MSIFRHQRRLAHQSRCCRTTEGGTDSSMSLSPSETSAEGLPMSETKIAIYITDTTPVNALIAVAKGWWERWL